VDGRLVKRKLGPRRKPGTREGLIKSQAESRLRSLMQEVKCARPVERMTVEQVGKLYIGELKLVGRKPSTLRDYEIILARHLVPHFGRKAVDRITHEDVAALLRAKLGQGLAHSTLNHFLNVLSEMTSCE